MIVLGMYIGCFLGMYLSKSIWEYALCGIVGAWIGALINVARSSSKKDAWIIYRKEAVRQTIILLLGFSVLYITAKMIDNYVVFITVAIVTFMILDNWQRITKGAFNWKQTACIGGGVALAVLLDKILDFPAWLGFFVWIGCVIIGNIIYYKIFHKKVRNDEKEHFFYISLLGKIAAMDGEISSDEEAFIRSRFVNPDPRTKVENETNDFILATFHKAASTDSDWKEYLSDFVRTVYLNQSDALDDYISDICLFSMLRGKGMISPKRFAALHLIAKRFDIPVVFLDRLIVDMTGYFNGFADSSQPNYSPSDSIDDYYSILGCDRCASYEEVKRAYRMKSKMNHPDKVRSFGFDEAAVENAKIRMQKINEAYEKIKKYNNWK